VEASELLRLPIFADLPDDQIAWFIGQSQALALKPDEVYVHQGDPADAMFVVLDRQLQIRGELSSGLVTFVSKPGDVTGVLPFSRMKQFPLTGRALNCIQTEAAALSHSLGGEKWNRAIRGSRYFCPWRRARLRSNESQ
jgi:CRP-like cAMP-binding protein